MPDPRSRLAKNSSVESPLSVGEDSCNSLVRLRVGSRMACWRREDCLRVELDLVSYC